MAAAVIPTTIRRVGGHQRNAVGYRVTVDSHRKLRSRRGNALVDSLVGDWAGEILRQLKIPLAALLDTTARVMQVVRRVRNLLGLRPSGSNRVQDKADPDRAIQRGMKPA